MPPHNCTARPVFPPDARVELDSLAIALSNMSARVDTLEKEVVLLKKREKAWMNYIHQHRATEEGANGHHQTSASGESALKSNCLP